jgi:hypothetical protein
MLALLIAEAALDEREGVLLDVLFKSPGVPGMEAMADDAERENVRRSRGNISIRSLFKGAEV